VRERERYIALCYRNSPIIHRTFITLSHNRSIPRNSSHLPPHPSLPATKDTQCPTAKFTHHHNHNHNHSLFNFASTRHIHIHPPMLARQGTYSIITEIFAFAIVGLMKVASGRIISSGGHSGGNTTSKRATSGSSTTTTASAETLGSAVKLGGTRDKERKEKEDVELKPPWDLLPYSRDVSAGTKN
jgi:hypothetical protein